MESFSFKTNNNFSSKSTKIFKSVLNFVLIVNTEQFFVGNKVQFNNWDKLKLKLLLSIDFANIKLFNLLR